MSSMQTVDRSRAEIDWPILTVKRAPVSKHSNPILMISPWVTPDNKVTVKTVNLYGLLELNCLDVTKLGDGEGWMNGISSSGKALS